MKLWDKVYWFIIGSLVASLIDAAIAGDMRQVKVNAITLAVAAALEALSWFADRWIKRNTK